MSRAQQIFNYLKAPLSWGTGLIKKGAIALGIGAGVAVADDVGNFGVANWVKQKTADLGRNSAEVKELTEARAGQLDSEWRGRNTIVYLASLVGSIAKALGFTGLSEAVEKFVKSETADLKKLHSELSPGQTPENRNNIRNITNASTDLVGSGLSGIAQNLPSKETVLATGIVAGTGYAVAKTMSGRPTGGVAGGSASIAANTADDAARGLGGRIFDSVKSGLSRLPGVGKFFGGAAVVGGVVVGGAVVNGVLSSEAAAAPASPAAPSAPVNLIPSGVPAIPLVASETAPTARSLAVNAINGAYSGTFNGVATFAGAPVDGATWLINKTVGRGLGFQIDRPFLGSESINNGLTGLRGAYHRAIGNDLDRVQPTNTAERIAYEGASLAGNVAASGGALGLLRGAWAKVASGVFTPTAPVSHAAPMSRPALVGGTMDGFHMN